MLLEREQLSMILVDVQEKLIGAIHDGANVVANCQWLLRFAREMSIAYFVSEQYPKGLGHTVPELIDFKTDTNQLEKTAFSCFAESACQTVLTSKLKPQVLLMGIEAHVCVLQSALDLKKQGFDVFVAVDAIGSRYEHDYRTALLRFEHNQIELVSSEMVFFECIKDSKHDKFKQLSQTFLQQK